MVGGNTPRIRAPRIRRGTKVLAAGVLSLMGVAASWALADDSPSLRAMAQRYVDPTQLFEPEEDDITLNHVFVPEKAFQLPPASPPTIEFAVDEPAAFVTSVSATDGHPSPVVNAAHVSSPSPATAKSATRSTSGSRPAVASARRTPSSAKPEAAPQLHFAEAEPPAFVIMSVAAPKLMPAPPFNPVPARGPVSLVVAPAEVPDLTVPMPPAHIANEIPDAPAFVSTADPLNITIGAVAMAMADQTTPPPAPGADASAAAAQSGAPGSFGEVEKLGDAPPSNTLEFLRQQAILLKPGKWQFDWGLAYSVFNFNAAVPIVNHSGQIVGVANERERLQLMTIPFAARYGICDGLQAYVNAPLGWSNTEITTDNGDSLTNNFGGMGDMSAGLNWQIMKGCGAYVPDVIASVGFIAPTGHATFATSLFAPNSALGQGFWDITCSVLAVHSIDPVVFYYGGGYVHRFDASFGSNIEVEPGQEFDYLFGVGFAVNPWVTISGTFIGNYLTRFGVNDVSIPGSDLDLMRFRVSVTVVKDKHICEPFGEIGMTPDTPSRIGVTFTY
jgi:hypothetical protein